MAAGFRFAGAAVTPNDVPSWTPFHWVMALAVGAYFAISNFVQNTAIIGGYSNLFIFTAALIGFVVVYNIFALTLRTAWELPRVLQKGERPNLSAISGHASVLIVGGAAQLYAIAVLTAMVRTTGNDWPSSIAFYYREIVVSCAPIWGIVYAGAFSALRLLAARGRETAQTPPTRIEYSQSGVRKYIETASISMIEACGNYAEIITHSHRATVRIPIEKLERMLPATEFMRIHRSVIVRKALIHEIHRSPSGAYSAILENGCAPPLSRRRLGAVRAALTAKGDGATSAPE